MMRSGMAAWRTSSSSSSPSPEPASKAVIAGPAIDYGSSATSERTSVSSCLGDVPIVDLPSTLNLSAFRNDVELSWLIEHYAHRPNFARLIAESASNSFGEAARLACLAMANVLFTGMRNVLDQQSRVVQPYSDEYMSAIRSLSQRLPSFDQSQCEQILVPVLLLFNVEVRSRLSMVLPTADFGKVWFTGDSEE